MNIYTIMLYKKNDLTQLQIMPGKS